MYPSKSDGMFVRESLIFRSDSNGEDLEGYAGAGLYDSITMDTTQLRKVDYASDRRARPRAPLPSAVVIGFRGCGVPLYGFPQCSVHVCIARRYGTFDACNKAESCSRALCRVL